MPFPYPTITLIPASPIRRSSRTTSSTRSTPIRPIVLVVGKTVSTTPTPFLRQRTNSQDSWGSDDTLISSSSTSSTIRQSKRRPLKSYSLTEEQKRTQYRITKENEKNHKYCNELRRCADCDKLYAPRRKPSLDQLELQLLDERFAKKLEDRVVELKKSRSVKARFTSRTKKLYTGLRSAFCGATSEKDLGREGREYEWEEEKRFYQYDELRDERRRHELEVTRLLSRGEVTEQDVLTAPSKKSSSQKKVY